MTSRMPKEETDVSTNMDAQLTTYCAADTQLYEISTNSSSSHRVRLFICLKSGVTTVKYAHRPQYEMKYCHGGRKGEGNYMASKSPQYFIWAFLPVFSIIPHKNYLIHINVIL